MARSTFGGTAEDVVESQFSFAGRRLKAAVPNTAVTFWSAATDGTQYTDLLDGDGVAATSITSDADGFLPAFQGPDGVTQMWADAGGARKLVFVQGLAGPAGPAGATGPAGAPGGSDASFAGWLGTSGSATELAARNIAAGVSVKSFGAVGDGVTDDTTAFTNAVAALSSLSYRGRVLVPRGTYIVQGLPIRSGLFWEGAGAGATILRLPASPTADMFASVGTANIVGGGISGFSLDGQLNTTRDAISFASLDPASEVYDFWVQNNYIDGFRRGYNGSDGDRDVFVLNNRIWHCTSGIFGNGEHPVMEFNDLRYCTVGIDGTWIDATIVGNKVNYCGKAVGANIWRSLFANNWFYLPTDTSTTGAVISGAQNTFIGCVFTGASTASRGLNLNGDGITVEGCQFLGSWDRAITMTLNTTGVRIVGNRFECTTGQGIQSDGSKVHTGMTIMGNTFTMSGAGAGIRCASGVVVSSIISGNTFLSTAATTGTGAVLELNSTSNLDSIITGNVFNGSAGAIIRAIKVYAQGFIVHSNMFTGVTTPLALTGTPKIPAAAPATATGTDAAVINALSTELRTLGVNS